MSGALDDDDIAPDARVQHIARDLAVQSARRREATRVGYLHDDIFSLPHPLTRVRSWWALIFRKKPPQAPAARGGRR